jgi:hypothetical protein
MDHTCYRCGDNNPNNGAEQVQYFSEILENKETILLMRRSTTSSIELL